MPPTQYTILTKRVCLQTFEIDASQAYTRVDPRYVSFTIDTVCAAALASWVHLQCSRV